MGVEFNGKGNDYNFLVGKGINLPQEATKQVEAEKDVPVVKQETKELGAKLLEQVQPTFVQKAKLPQSDEVQLKEMFALAGIQNPKVPTKAVYERITGDVGVLTKSLEKLEITNNAEKLFNSPGFSALNKLAGIKE